MIKHLPWDSSFLSLPVGQMQVQNSSFASVAEAAAFDLLYVFSDQLIVFPESFTANFSVQLVDEKLTYAKPLTSHTASIPEVQLLPKDFVPDEAFEALAIQSGIYSRFSMDEKFPREKFREMYRLWLQRSINRSLADAVLVYQQDGALAGFITLREKEGDAEIGLVAVDHHYRGMGIGTKLLEAAESRLNNIPKAKYIRVVTQAANLPACRLYEKAGYHVTKRQYVYHCWKYA
ncbi:MAG: GNAT family N-acetyltransferase [Lacibacter sp.]